MEVVYRALARFSARSRLVADHIPARMVEAYWQQPWDTGNAPGAYRDGARRSQFLAEIVSRHAGLQARVLEIGCNVGRNLHYLRQAGYRHLEGLDINTAALAELPRAFPDLATIPLHAGPAEDVLPQLKAGSYDVVFTMWVLTHVHPEVADSVFDSIVRVARGIVVTFEPEGSPHDARHWRHFPRDYQPIFEQRGLRQVEAIDAAKVIDGGMVRVFVAS